MGDARETSSPAPNYNTPVKDLAYKDLLTSTFTLASHDRGIKTWCVPATYPECVYCGKRYRYERFNVECHMDPNIGKATGRERTVAPCKESLPTSRGPHRKRFLEVQAEIRAHMASDKNTLLQEAAASAKRKLISVGGCADTPLDLAAGGNADGKRPCLGNGQTVLMKTPTQAEFVECWSEAIPSFGRPLSQLLAWDKQPCAWAREQLLERGTLLCHIAIHSLGKSFRRQTRGWMKRTWRG